MSNVKRKSMLEAGVVFSGGGAVLGLLVDKISQSGSYSTTRNGALIGSMIGIGLAALSNALEESMVKINEGIEKLNVKVPTVKSMESKLKGELIGKGRGTS
jgi:hypothetical protein